MLIHRVKLSNHTILFFWGEHSIKCTQHDAGKVCIWCWPGYTWTISSLKDKRVFNKMRSLIKLTQDLPWLYFSSSKWFPPVCCFMHSIYFHFVQVNIVATLLCKQTSLCWLLLTFFNLLIHMNIQWIMISISSIFTSSVSICGIWKIVWMKENTLEDTVSSLRECCLSPGWDFNCHPRPCILNTYLVQEKKRQCSV